MTDIPLTVIGGYLGSGKTTLLNEMLDRRDGRRIAVIVNDFGQISIDAQILGEREGRTWEIVNGCICCDLADGMAAAIESIRSATPPPASVFAEVSGVGQPDVVARWGDHPGFVHGGATVCVDVLAIRSQARRRWIGDTVRAQLHGADRFVLTKTDLASADQIAEVRDWLTTMSDAEVIERETAVTGVAPTPAGESATAGSAQSGSAPDHDVRAADAHRSWTFAVDAPIDRGRLRPRGPAGSVRPGQGDPRRPWPRRASLRLRFRRRTFRQSRLRTGRRRRGPRRAHRRSDARSPRREH